MPKHLIVLDDRELATVLASMRNFAVETKIQGPEWTRQWPHFREPEIEPLGPAEIDTLCERINTQHWWLAAYFDKSDHDLTVYIEDGQKAVEKCIVQMIWDQTDEDDAWHDEINEEDHQTNMDAVAIFLEHTDDDIEYFDLNEVFAHA